MVDGRRRFSSDGWDGYPAARDRLLGAIADNGLRSCVVLSGDAHTRFVCDLKRDFDDEQAPPIATELCGTSITSRGRAQSTTDASRAREPPHPLWRQRTPRLRRARRHTAALHSPTPRTRRRHRPPHQRLHRRDVRSRRRPARRAAPLDPTRNAARPYCGEWLARRPERHQLEQLLLCATSSAGGRAETPRYNRRVTKIIVVR